MSNLIKCRFCEWSIPKFFTKRPSGKLISGYVALQEHIRQEHPIEWSLIQNSFDEEEQWRSESEWMRGQRNAFGRYMP